MARSPRDSSGGDVRIVEHDGKPWKPRTGATATFEELLQARARFLEVDDHVLWNPWDRHLLEEAENAILAVGDQWTRAEPGFRQLTQAECQERMDRWDAEFEAGQHRKKAERQERARQHDPEREKARLHLLEDEAILRYARQQAAEMDGGSRYPRMPEQRRANMLNELTELRGCIDQVLEELRSTGGRSERAAVRRKSWLDEYKLKDLLAVTRPSAEEMCSECFRPQSWHRWRTGGDGLFYTGPCPAFGGVAADRVHGGFAGQEPER